MAGLGARSVLVTGANRGIGLELVRQLLSKPDSPQWLFACSREPDGERGQELRNLVSKHPNLVIVKLDATSPTSIKDAAVCVENHLKGSGLNLLINNAGVFKDVALDAVDVEDMISGYKINVIGPLLVSQAALNMLTQCQSVEFKDFGILCTIVHPGWVKTEMGGQEADLTVDESVRGILDVLSKLSDEHNGAFISWKGNKMPW
ncbi:C-factor-like isoform X3 [Eublepharis macularius]|uniref:C-factor-like isoform X3 n=1 Tax=Eublepharis macularius TaxID=481883 RepID=A0AA97LID2_EUBMA|nr:C-factor-like isoform X3 [Eublepharis macularius]